MSKKRIVHHAHAAAWAVGLFLAPAVQAEEAAARSSSTVIEKHIVAFAPFQQQLNTYQPPRTYGLTMRFRR